MQGFFCSHAGVEDPYLRTTLDAFGYNLTLQKLADIYDDAQVLEAEEAAEETVVRQHNKRGNDNGCLAPSHFGHVIVLLTPSATAPREVSLRQR